MTERRTGRGGSRPRVGLMVPSSNTMMEADFRAHIDPSWTIHTARMFMEDTTAEAECRMLDEHAIPAARDLATARPDIVVFGCTSAGALRGRGYDTELCERVSELTGVPTVSTIASVNEALHRSGAERVGIITPYIDELNDRIRASVEAAGVRVARIAGLGITDNYSIAEVPVSSIVAFAVEVLVDQDIDAAFISCTNFAGVEARTEAARALRVPVLTSNQAVLEATTEAVAARVPARSEPTNGQ